VFTLLYKKYLGYCTRTRPDVTVMQRFKQREHGYHCHAGCLLPRKTAKDRHRQARATAWKTAYNNKLVTIWNNKKDWKCALLGVHWHSKYFLRATSLRSFLHQCNPTSLLRKNVFQFQRKPIVAQQWVPTVWLRRKRRTDGRALTCSSPTLTQAGSYNDLSAGTEHVHELDCLLLLLSYKCELSKKTTSARCVRLKSAKEK
jgi:hypothetical protein